MTNMTDFVCAICKTAYQKKWSDEEANKEAKQIWGVKEASKRKDFIVICDDCYKKRSLKEIKIMGKEYQSLTQKAKQRKNTEEKAAEMEKIKCEEILKIQKEEIIKIIEAVVDETKAVQALSDIIKALRK